MRFDSSRLLCAIDYVHDSISVSLHANRVNTSIGTDVPGQVLQYLKNVINLFVVDCLGPCLLRHLQTIVEAINGDHAFSSEHEGASNRKLAYRAASPDGDRIALLNVGIHRPEIAGWEN